MPGICGILNLDATQPPDGKTLEGMHDALTWRAAAPGRFISGEVAIAGPLLHSKDKSILLFLDGEIYDPTGPGEVVHAYEQSGEKFVRRLRGAFALVIWDANQRKLLLARDHAGVRPLYYARCGGNFVFASEIRAMLRFPGIGRQVDPVSLDQFLTYEFISGPATIFKSVRKLPPAHLLTCDHGKLDVRRYWNLDLAGPEEADEAACADRLLDALRDSVEIRIRGDANPTVLLSGGIDSSAIVALASEIGCKVRTISIGFADQSRNELPYARMIARRFRTEHHEFVTPYGITVYARDLIGLLDQPFADSSVFPTLFAYELASKNSDAIVTGDGGDELFAGYDTIAAERADHVYRILPGLLRNRIIPKMAEALPPTAAKKGPVNRLRRFVEGASLEPQLGHMRWRTFLSPARKQELYSPEFQACMAEVEYPGEAKTGFPSLNDQLLADFETYLPDYTLVKVDRLSAAFSLRVRMPFLDQRVIGVAAAIPCNLKLKGFCRKHILKKALLNMLPKQILNRGKEGFSAPMRRWLRQDLKSLMFDALSPKRIMAQGFFNYNCIRRMVEEHLAGRKDHSHRLWSLIVFSLWYEQNGS